MTSETVEMGWPEGTRVRVGVPADQPKAAIAALKKLLPGCEAVRSARLGLMEVVRPDGSSLFAYTIGLEAGADFDGARDKVANALRDVPAGRWPISVLPLEGPYFSEQSIEFYRRA